ncbi:MAG: nucleotide-sugar epimerase [Wendovervirus sonii]|uniref:Nucleotide-sugar epimerase n=1 Tax=phage Lak_Megaphage_Sonny TaxID=3109229 RepID=A0ABZ0Z514_9CAUD|nr:MAG: nucleotide-sugar epimerase [phage Lak_Megaphage_Sonny]
MNKETCIYVAGHTGLVGSAIVRQLKNKGYFNIITKTHDELDLTDQAAVKKFFKEQHPQVVILAAAMVGGIKANNIYRGEFIMKNMQIQCNVISEAYNNKVEKLLFLGSSCIYPKNADQPISEKSLLTGELEYTNEPYAIAKIAGLKMCESYNMQFCTNYISVMPTNLYGYNDNFSLSNSHVLPGIIRRMHLGKLLRNRDFASIREDIKKRPLSTKKESDIIINSYKDWQLEEILSEYDIYEDCVKLWGTGTPLREFMWSDDLADACVYIMEKVDFQDILKITKQEGSYEIRNCHINIGTGEEYTIKQLAEKIAKAVGYTGNILFNTNQLDGTPRKLLNCDTLHELGWKHKVSIDEGIEKLYQWYNLENQNIEILNKAKDYQISKEGQNISTKDLNDAYIAGAKEQFNMTADTLYKYFSENTFFDHNGKRVFFNAKWFNEHFRSI